MKEYTMEPIIEVIAGSELIPDVGNEGIFFKTIKSVIHKIEKEYGVGKILFSVSKSHYVQPNEYQVLLNKNIVSDFKDMKIDQFLCLDFYHLENLVEGKIKTTSDPAFGVEAVIIDEKNYEEAKKKGCICVDFYKVLETDLYTKLENKLSELINSQNVNVLIKRIRKNNSEIYESIFIENSFDESEMEIILKYLLEEKISVHDIMCIFRTIDEYITINAFPDFLAERIRENLANSFISKYEDIDGNIPIIKLNKNLCSKLQKLFVMMSKKLSESEIQKITEESQFIVNKLNRIISNVLEESQSVPVFVCPAALRRNLYEFGKTLYVDFRVISDIEYNNYRNLKK